MKSTICSATLILLLALNSVCAQIINVGFGLETEVENWPFAINASFEISPNNSVLSFNLDPSFSDFNNQFTLTLPAYVKFSFGKKVKVAPMVGGFSRSANNQFLNSYGLLLGLSVEKNLSSKLSVNLSGKAMRDFYYTTDKYDNEYYYDGGFSYWIGVGLKWMVSREE